MQFVSYLDPLMANEMLLNQKSIPQFLKDENKQMFANYLKTWYDMGIWHIRYNLVDKEALMNAQVRPDLVVRVAGYSDYWIDLGNPVQEDIITQTEQSFAC